MADIIDYKKEYKDLYLPKAEPSTIKIPEIIFAAVEGKGNPNETDGEYQAAVGVLYGIQYTIKMSKKEHLFQMAILIMLCRPLKACGGLITVMTGHRNRNQNTAGFQ